MDTQQTSNAVRYFTPGELAMFVRMCREGKGWTQETLAEISGLTVRTIQRVERAESSSVDTRRALARAFEIEDIDFFNKPHTFKSAEQLRAETEEFQRNHVMLDTEVANTGKQLAELA